MKLIPGELYFIGELDHVTRERTPFVKIGIVREKDGRDSAKRLKEHQTGNPRQIIELEVVETPFVERVETAMHALHAPIGVGGEWFRCVGGELDDVIGSAHGIIASVRAAEPAVMQAEELTKEPSSGDLVAADSTLRDVHHRLLSTRELLRGISAAKRAVRDALGGALTAGLDIDRLVTMTRREKGLSLDKKALRDDHPETYARYVIESTKLSQRFIPTKVSDLNLDMAHLDSELASIVNEVNRRVEDRVTDESAATALHEMWLDLLSREGKLALDDELTEAIIKSSCGLAPGIEGVCSWKRELTLSTSFDDKTFAATEPELHERYVVVKDAEFVVNVARNRNYAM